MSKRIRKRVVGSLNNQRYLLLAKDEGSKLENKSWKEASRVGSELEPKEEETTLPTTFSVSLPKAGDKPNSGAIHSLIHQRQLAYLHQQSQSPKMANTNTISEIVPRDSLTPFTEEPMPMLAETKIELEASKVLNSKVTSSQGEVMQRTHTIAHQSIQEPEKVQRVKRSVSKASVIVNFLNFRSRLYSKPNTNKLPKRLTILFQGQQHSS